MLQTLPQHPFLDFSKQLLAQAHINSLCQQFAEQHNMNTSLLLFCCWFAVNQQGRLNKQDFQKIFNFLHPWHEKITVEIFRLNHSLEQKKLFELAKETSQIQHVSEQVEQLSLCDIVLKPPLSYRTIKQKLIDAAHNLEIYFRLTQVTLSTSERFALHQLLRSIFTEITSENIQLICEPILCEKA